MEDMDLTFTAAEAAQLTGVPAPQQRDWRRHGFMPAAPQGWVRHSVSDLCRLFLLRLFSAQNIGPASAVDVVDRLELSLRDRVTAVTFNGTAPGAGDGCAVIWATGELRSYPSVQAAFDAATPEQQAGPCVVIDLDTLATPFGIRVRDFLLQRAAGV